MVSKFKYGSQRRLSHHLVPEVQTQGAGGRDRVEAQRVVDGESGGHRSCDLQDVDNAGSYTLVCQDEPGQRSALYRSIVQGIHVPDHATGVQEFADEDSNTLDTLILSGDNRAHQRGRFGKWPMTDCCHTLSLI